MKMNCLSKVVLLWRWSNQTDVWVTRNNSIRASECSNCCWNTKTDEQTGDHASPLILSMYCITMLLIFSMSVFILHFIVSIFNTDCCHFPFHFCPSCGTEAEILMWKVLISNLRAPSPQICWQEFPAIVKLDFILLFSSVWNKFLSWP